MTITITGGTGELQVSGGAQGSNVSLLPGGGWVVTWNDSNGTAAQVYNASAAKVGGPIQVSAQVGYNTQATPLAGGGFAVIREGQAPGTSGYAVYLQKFDSAGVKVGTETSISKPGVLDEGLANVTTLSDGSFLVVMHPSSPTDRIVARHFDSSGAPLADEFEFNPGSARNVTSVDVAALPGGGYMTVWKTFDGMFLQKFAADDTALTAATRFDTYMLGMSGGPLAPQIAILASGGFVVTWTDFDGSHANVVAQRFNSAGAKVGGETIVNTRLTDEQEMPSVAALADGGYVITWQGRNQDDPNDLTTYKYGVYAQRYDANGVRVGVETLINDTVVGDQKAAHVIALPTGGYVVTWDQTVGSYPNPTVSTIFEKVVQPSVVGSTLTSAIETATGDSANDIFLAAPSALNSGDQINGGGGIDQLKLTSTGLFDFTGVTLNSLEKITGTAGDDTLRFTNAPVGVGLESGGGHDTLALAGKVNLGALSLTGNWTVESNADAVFTLTNVNQIGLVAGGAGFLRVDASTLPLTAAQRAQLFNQGADQIVQKSDAGTRTFEATGSAYSGVASTVSGNMPSTRGTAVTSLADGGYVVVWNSFFNGMGAQRYGADGVAIGGAVSLGGGAPSQEAPVITGLAGGGFVVSWWGSNGVASNGQLSRVFDANGAPTGEVVNVRATAEEYKPAIHALPDGGFVLAYIFSPFNGLFLQKFNAAGAKVGGEITVTMDNGGGAVAMSLLQDGGYVVVWSAMGAGGLHAQRLDASGAKVGAEFPVVSATTSTHPSAVTLADGTFVVVWQELDRGSANGVPNIYARHFSANGQSMGSDFLVNTTTDFTQSLPSITALGDGGFIITWNSLYNTGGQGIYTQRYDAAGNKVGLETWVADGSVHGASDPSITGLNSGGYALAWLGWEGDAGSGQAHLMQSAAIPLDYKMLTPNADTYVGNATAGLVVASPADLGAADSLDGGGGVDDFELAAPGVLNLTTPTKFTGFEQIFGSDGSDTFIVSQARLAGIAAFNGRLGADIITTADAQLDLSGAVLTGIETITSSNGAGTHFTVAAANAMTVHGAGANDVLTVVGGVLAGAQKAALRGAQGIERFTDSLLGDFNADGISDLLFRRTDGQVANWQLDGTAISGGGTIGDPPSGSRVVGMGDFGGDGASDLLLRDGSGQYIAWSVNGAHLASAPGAAWTLVGTGDFNADGKADLILRNSDATSYRVSLQNGSGAIASGDFSGPGVGDGMGVGWTFRATGDFNGDGKSELLFQNAGSGLYAVRFMNGVQIGSGASVGNPGDGWSFAGIGDFDGDGKSDILFQDATGQLASWKMNGTQAVAGGGNIGNPGAAWSLFQIGDYNGDGRSDLIFRHADGTLATWTLNGTQITGGGNVGNPGSAWLPLTAEAPFTAPMLVFKNAGDGSYASWMVQGTTLVGGGGLGAASGFTVKAVGDFNADGVRDLVFQATDGAVATWLTNGHGLTGGSNLGSPGAAWSLVAAGDFSGDGSSDLLFRNTNGTYATWDVHLGSVIGGGTLGTAAGFTAVGTGDLDGDGHDDILFRNDATGDLAAWMMNDTQIRFGASIGNPGGTWAFKAMGDMNGDGHADILFQDAAGMLASWDMNGGQIIGGGNIGNAFGTWAFKELLDLNGDGKSDVVFQDNTGTLAAWTLNDTAIVGGGTIGNPGGGWTFVV